MINATAQKAHGQNQRCRDMPQRLVKIGAVLLGNAVVPVGRDLRKRLRRHGIEIPDDRIQGHTRAQGHLCPPVGGHETGGKGLNGGHIRQIRRTAAKQGHGVRTVNNRESHAGLMQFSETDHNVAAK